MKIQLIFTISKITHSRYGCAESISEFKRVIDDQDMDQVIHEVRNQFHVISIERRSYEKREDNQDGHKLSRVEEEERKLRRAIAEKIRRK